MSFVFAGPYIIGQKLGHSPVDSVVQYLAKKENSTGFVQLKVCGLLPLIQIAALNNVILVFVFISSIADINVRQQFSKRETNARRAPR